MEDSLIFFLLAGAWAKVGNRISDAYLEIFYITLNLDLKQIEFIRQGLPFIFCKGVDPNQNVAFDNLATSLSHCNIFGKPPRIISAD